MMKRLLSKAAAWAAILALAGPLAACGQGQGSTPASAGPEAAISAADYTAVAVIVGVHSNAPLPSEAGVVGAAMDAAAARGIPLSVIVDDGAPAVQAQMSTRSCGSDPDCAKSNDATIAAFRSQLASVAPKAAEADLLGAEQLAARVLGQRQGRRLLVVADSGLSTAGKVRMQDPGMLEADPKDVSAQLTVKGELPALDNTDVYLSGIGDTLAPQQPLSQPDRARLGRIWAEVAAAGKAASVHVLDAAPGVQGPSSAPPVTPVPVTAGGPVHPAQSSEPGKVLAVLSQAKVQFQENTADLVDPPAAQAALSEVASYAKSSGIGLTVTGCSTSWGDPALPASAQVAWQDRLSLDRASAVRNLLVRLGLDPSRVQPVGLGSRCPGSLPEKDATGAWLAGPMAQNRRVIVAVAG